MVKQPETATDGPEFLGRRSPRPRLLWSASFMSTPSVPRTALPNPRGTRAVTAGKLRYPDAAWGHCRSPAAADDIADSFLPAAARAR